MQALKTPFFSIVTAALFIATPSLAGTQALGPRTGGGGKAIVCHNTAGEIKSVETLDLWEAREIQKLQIPYSSVPLAKQIADATERLKNVVYFPFRIKDTDDQGHETIYRGGDAFVHALRETTDMFVSGASFVERLHGKTLTRTPDSFEDAYPDNCSVEQAVIFHDDGMGVRVVVNEDLVDLMDVQNQAALYVHEALYRILRSLDGESNSLRTRRSVGLVFSGESFAPAGSFVPDHFAYCVNQSPDGPTTQLLLYPDPTAAPPTVPSPTFDTSFVVYPLSIGGVLVMDYGHSFQSFSFGLGLHTIDDLIARVGLPPIANPNPENSFGFPLGRPGSRVDFELFAEVMMSTFSNSDVLGFSVSDVRAPWPIAQGNERVYLQCTSADKNDFFR